MKLALCHFSGAKKFGVTFWFFNFSKSCAVQYCVYSVYLSFFVNEARVTRKNERITWVSSLYGQRKITKPRK